MCRWAATSCPRFKVTLNGQAPSETQQSAQTTEGPPLAPEPLPEDPDVLWANPLPGLAGAATVPDMQAALPSNWDGSLSGRPNKTRQSS